MLGRAVIVDIYKRGAIGLFYKIRDFGAFAGATNFCHGLRARSASPTGSPSASWSMMQARHIPVVSDSSPVDRIRAQRLRNTGGG